MTRKEEKLKRKYFNKKQKASENDYQLNVWKFFNEGNIFHKISGFFRKTKYARDRARKGYCDYDLWDMDIFFVDLIIRSLEEHKEYTCGYPDGKYSSFEDWTNAIEDGVNHFKKYKYLMNDDNNVYYLAYMQAIRKEDDSDKRVIRDKFDAEDKRMCEEAKNELRLGFEFLIENIRHLWW